MPKNPNSGFNDPQDMPAPDTEGLQPMSASERRSRAAAENRPGAGSAAEGTEAPPPEEPSPSASPPPPKTHAIGDRKKQFVIAPRQPMDALQAMSFQPLQLSVLEQALNDSPDIDVVDTIRCRSTVGMLADGAAAAQGVLVARMTEQKAGALQQQGQGRLVVERDQHLALMDPVFYQPALVSSVVPTSGPAFNAVIQVVSKDGAPVADAEVSLFGSMLPATGKTDANGQVSLALFGETADSIRSLYVKPKSDYWSFYHRDPDISSDEPNTVTLKALAEWPTLAGMPRQKVVGWGQKAMRMDQLPPSYRGQGIRIAVIDSGAANSHEGLARIREGFDVINKKTNPNGWNEDIMGHGSHCAGVIGAADLAYGLRGFAPDAEIHACKLFPGGQVSQLIDALEYCIEKQIDVVNLSLGGAEPSEALEQQILRAKRAGIACIVAAGNSGGPVQYPATSPNVLAVAAIGKLDEFPPDSYHAQTLTQNVDANGFFSASFSCHGPQVGVCGPGVAIASTVPPNNYAAWDGTSMAAPHITGLAALVLAHHPDFQGVFKGRGAERVERLFQIIKMSARRVSLGDQTHTGFGLPDALVAVGGQGGMQPQQMYGQQVYGQAGARNIQLEQYALDPVMAAYAAMMPGGLSPQQQMGPFAGLPFGPGAAGFGRSGW